MVPIIQLIWYKKTFVYATISDLMEANYIGLATGTCTCVSAIPHRIKLGEKFDALGWPKTLLEVFALVLAGLQNFDFLHIHVGMTSQFLCLSRDSL